jgi:hypothetical protein
MEALHPIQTTLLPIANENKSKAGHTKKQTHTERKSNRNVNEKVI